VSGKLDGLILYQEGVRHFMFPEDRVLVGVINRKRDLEFARNEHWYRIPQEQMKRGVDVEYVAFFLSRAFKERNGGIYWYAEKRGLELAYRRDLLPKEADHKHADRVYYKVQIGDLIEKDPPVLNPTNRTITFVYTTWDRFVQAKQISDLYSKSDYFVDRIYHALRERGISSERTWGAEYRDAQPPQLRILCERGPLTASTGRGEGSFFLDESQQEDAVLASILAEIARQGGPMTIGIPLDGI
jgi:hypothetical protein